MAASARTDPHPCARGAPIDAADTPPVYYMRDFDASKITFTRPSWDNVKGAATGAASGAGGAGASATGGRRPYNPRAARTEAQSVVVMGPKNSRTMYCRSTVPNFRIQMVEGVIQKVSLPGGDDAGDGGVDIPDHASDAELLQHYAGKRLNVKVRFDDIEPNAADDTQQALARAQGRCEFTTFWNEWKEAAVQPFVQHHEELYPEAPLIPTVMKQHLSNEAYDQSRYESARQIFEKKSPVFFQKETTKSYTVRMRVQVQRNFDPNHYGFNECMFFAHREETDAAGAVTLTMTDASVLRRGARITAVICSGGIYMNGACEFGHHVQMMQAVVKPYRGGVAPAPRLSVHLPGVSTINIMIPTEAPPMIDDEHENEHNQPKKRNRREDDIAAFYDDSGANDDTSSFA